jgi:hypothetical protein
VRRFRTFYWLFPIVVTLLIFCLTTPVVASGHVTPTQWPSSNNMSPKMEGWPNGIRFYGEDRYQTNLAMILALRGAGSFPFGSPDPTSASAQNLAKANGWWGVGYCPKALIIVAGDSPSDALAAAALSDPTGLSSEPYLRRSASADPLFDPVGGFARVDTDYAPVVITVSSRDGGDSLAAAAMLAINDMRSGGCSNARQAIIIGGFQAISSEIEVELLEIGINEVFRVGGANRYETAARVAYSLGTESIPDSVFGCADPSAGDVSTQMGYYANSVVEWRKSSTECELWGNTVVLADGIVGADALAAGWWTSYWQVPVLLHNGSERLPSETIKALQTLDIDNLVILGGEERISAVVETQAIELSGAAVRRVGGSNRYSTSVAMAKHFGGWWPVVSGRGFESSIFCVAAVSGNQSDAQGWADALGAGPWCSAASGAAANPGAPQRALDPSNGANPIEIHRSARPGHDAVPILLVAAGEDDLPQEILEFLQNIFEPADNWCSSVARVGNCISPGFFVGFGGESVLSKKAVSKLSALASGGRASAQIRTPSEINDSFLTELDMSPIYHNSGVGTKMACVERGEVTTGRWLALGFDSDERVRTNVDAMMRRWNVTDADGVTRTSGVSAPGCISFNSGLADVTWLRSVGIDGRASKKQLFDMNKTKKVSFTAPLNMVSPAISTGIDSTSDASKGGQTSLSFLTVDTKIGMLSNGFINVIKSAGLTVTLNRGIDAPNKAVDRFTATWTISDSEVSIAGVASGEAMLVNGTWKLRGATDLTGGSVNGRGGFSADLTTNSLGQSDDVISWEIDAIPHK